MSREKAVESEPCINDHVRQIKDCLTKNDESGLQSRDACERFEFCNFLDSSDCLQYYNLWSSLYDSDVRNANYNGPACTVSHVPHYIPDKNARILDVCAGTGACAMELKRIGYENVDALDGCQKMLTVARNRQLYKRYFLQILKPELECPIASETYDAVICAGGFVNGHLKAEVCREFAKLLKPGGTCIIGMRKAFLETVVGYKDRLEPFMDAMIEWNLVDKINQPKWFKNQDGIVFVYKKKP